MAKMSSFKMQQSSKRVAATIDDASKRSEYLDMMMQAQKINERFQTSRGRGSGSSESTDSE